MTANSTRNQCELKIEIAPADVETVDNALLELGNERWTVFENIVTRHAWIIGIFDTADDARRAWEQLEAQLEVVPVANLTLRDLPEQEWRDSYKAHFRAWKFGRLHWVPIWERATYDAPKEDVVLWLDPGQAFGTGNHETTRLCVERLVEHAATGNVKGTVIDAGCGSGILALSAAKLGYSSVAGFDNDPEAVSVSIENAAANNLQAQVRFYTADLVGGLEDVQADVILANILANVLIQFSRELTAAVAPGGWLVLSGILQQESGEVLKAFRAVAPTWQEESRSMGDWSDVVLVRPR